MFELSIKGDFSSAHFLRGHEGKCKKLHGHTWKVEATIEGSELNKIGILSDFSDLKGKLKGMLHTMDHICLNDIEFFKENNPTAENITKYLYEEYAKIISPLRLKKMCVWESDTASVVYYE